MTLWRIKRDGQHRCGKGGVIAAASLAILVGAHTSLAWAGADHPPLSPTRDAVVTYRFQTEVLPGDKKGSEPEHQVKVSFAASGDRLRIDPDDGRSATILNRQTQIMTLVSMQERRYIEFRPMHGLHNPFFLGLGMTYHPEGTEQIAHVTCQNWTIDSKRGRAKACVTEDGLILSEEGVDADGLTGRLKAIAVEYKDLPADIFTPPAGFQKFDPFAKMKKQLAQKQAQQAQQSQQGQPPVPGAAMEGMRRGGHEAVEQPAGDQPHSPDDSVGDGSVTHSDQPTSSNEGQ